MSNNAYSIVVTPVLLLGTGAPVMMPTGQDAPFLSCSITAEPADVCADCLALHAAHTKLSMGRLYMYLTPDPCLQV